MLKYAAQKLKGMLYQPTLLRTFLHKLHGQFSGFHSLISN